MLIDLSVLLNEATPVYPGDPPTKIEPAGVMDRDGFLDHHIRFGTHTGTHMDAPAHMLKDGKNLDDVPLEQFSGRGVYVRIEGEFRLGVVQKADIREGDIVIFHTGMMEKYMEPGYFKDFPSITEDVANYLVSKKVRIVGVDMCSPDKPPFPVHKILLSNDILIIENLCNLERLAGKKFQVYAFPIKFEMHAAPERVVAEVG